MVRPHKYAYNGIIVYYMVREQIEYSYDTNIGKFSKDPTFNYWFMRDIRYEPLPQTPTKLYAEIDRIGKEEKWPKRMSWKTLVKYLRDMVKEHTLEEYPRGHRKNNETLYRLSEYKLYLCLDYLFWQFQSHGRIGEKPYVPLLIKELLIQLLRKERIRRYRPRLQRIHSLSVF